MDTSVHIKLLLLGQSNVGKSSLVLRFVKGKFLESHDFTIGAAFLTEIIRIDDTIVKLAIWVKLTVFDF